jgi:hypothetical protein
MAKVQKVDRALSVRLDEFEQRLFTLKLEYEKYFNGVERVEPVRDRDDAKRMMREILAAPATHNTAQNFRITQLRARFNSLDLYITRNLVLVERGTHPKMVFRADLKDKERGIEEPKPQKQRKPTPEEQEERAFRAVYDQYLEARRQCNQSADMSYESVADVLRKQVTTIKSRFGASSVKFRVAIEEGKAKVKAVPMK